MSLHALSSLAKESAAHCLPRQEWHFSNLATTKLLHCLLPKQPKLQEPNMSLSQLRNVDEIAKSRSAVVNDSMVSI